MTTIKITPNAAQRAIEIANRGANSVVYHNHNFFGSCTSVGAEIYSSSKVEFIESLDELNFVNEDGQPVIFEIEEGLKL